MVASWERTRTVALSTLASGMSSLSTSPCQETKRVVGVGAAALRVTYEPSE
jgi:hypothetical protein